MHAPGSPNTADRCRDGGRFRRTVLAAIARNRPKQLLHLTNEHESMLSEAVSRLVPIIPREDIYVVTGKHLVDTIREAGVGTPPENVIAEPCKRNTSGCLAYAAAHFLAKYSPAGASLESRETQARLSMAVVTADPLIVDAEAFRKTIVRALDAAEREPVLAVIGIPPTRPETGYGYVQIAPDGQPLPGYPGEPAVHAVTSFQEKPSHELAEKFMATGRYFWNSGMFFWNVATFLSELEYAQPNLAHAVLAMAQHLQTDDAAGAARVFEGIEDISIDYALMERARRVLMVRATFAWDDVGAWPSLDRTWRKDAGGNVLVGDPVVVDCHNCIIYNDVTPAQRDIAVAVVGAQDLVVVVTDDAVLVIPKDRAQDVKHAVAELKRRHARQV